MSDIISLLASLGVIREDRLRLYFPRTRDREDVSVLRDEVSEVIVLSRSDHMSTAYYEDRSEKASLSVDGAEILTPRLEDNIRRREEFGGYIRNKRWLDFGCGLGGMLDEMASEAAWAVGLEPNKDRIAVLKSKGHHVVDDLSRVDDGSLDVITLFHVMEHLTDPVAVVEQLKWKLRPSGVLLVEVPHARDALITLYECEAFKKFTFWSEHLVLHTRQSLSCVLMAGGFRNVEVSGYQRYPLANHLFWLAKNRPGGHEVWMFLDNEEMRSEYEAVLARLDRTDSLLAVCRF